MTMTADPYPQNLIDDPDSPSVADDVAVQFHLVRAINRLAQAIEQDVLARLDNRPVVVANAPVDRPPLAPLPAVQVVAQKPPCPNHGLDRVRVSDKFPGFYCTAKDPQGPRGYCAWQFRTQG